MAICAQEFGLDGFRDIVIPHNRPKLNQVQRVKEAKTTNQGRRIIVSHTPSAGRENSQKGYVIIMYQRAMG
jgi:hypothetical protein